MKTCTICTKDLIGRQTKYCSRKCHNQSGNKKFQNYQAQQARAWTRKREAIAKFGGCCSKCGYNKNLAGLVFHHQGGKDFGIDSRAFSNHSQEVLDQELAKCQLLCHNCHMEEHYPNLTL